MSHKRVCCLFLYSICTINIFISTALHESFKAFHVLYTSKEKVFLKLKWQIKMVNKMVSSPLG